MRKIIAIAGLVLLCVSATAYGKDKFYKVVVADPFIEMHTGPGDGYPIFNVVDRGATVEVQKRHTDWFRIRTERGKVGWVSAGQLAGTLQLDGAQTEFIDPGREDFEKRGWEAGLQIGDIEGANLISAYAARVFTANLSAELWGSQITGDFSDGWMVNVNLVHQPFPTWLVSPFFTLGTGVIHVEPKATLVQALDRTDQLAHVGFGLRAHLTRRFLLRAEYKSYVVFTSRDDNQELEQWTAGFSFFF